MIVNHCIDCSQVEGHFDINYSPGWDNPEIWWKKLPDSECRTGGGGGSSSSLDSVLVGGAVNVDGNATALTPVKEAKGGSSQNTLLVDGGSTGNTTPAPVTKARKGSKCRRRKS